METSTPQPEQNDLQNMVIKQVPEAFIEALNKGENPLDCCDELFNDIHNASQKPQSDTGSIACPHNYFLPMAVSDYSDYKYALVREFIQNSDDAGAKKIDFIMDDGEEAENQHSSYSMNRLKRLTVKDDGCGMDKNILFNKLLCLGGTGKGGLNGSVGAFGKAKELLFFSWKKYCILTNNLMVLGEGANFTVYELPPQCAIKGTNVFLQMWNEKDIETVFSRSGRCRLNREHFEKSLCDFMYYYNGKAKISLDNTAFDKIHVKRKIFIENDEFLISYRKTKEVSPGDYPKRNFVFYTGGIPTIIDQQVSAQSNPKYDFEIVLKNPPYDCLNSNRDSLKPDVLSRFYNTKISMNEFADGGSFKREEKDEIVLYMPKDKPVQEQSAQGAGDSGQKTISMNLANTVQYLQNCGQNLSCVQKEDNGKEKEQQVRTEMDAEINFPYAIFTGDKSSTLLTRFSSSKQRFLFTLQLWDTVIKKLNTANESYNVFPGLIFSNKINNDNVLGCCMKMAAVSGNILFLNPVNNEKTFQTTDFHLDNLLMISQKMLMLACHEMAHVRFPYHDVDFCAQEGKLYRNLIEKNPRVVQELVDFCKSILPESKTKTKPVQARLC